METTSFLACFIQDLCLHVKFCHSPISVAVFT